MQPIKLNRLKRINNLYSPARPVWFQHNNDKKRVKTLNIDFGKITKEMEKRERREREEISGESNEN